MKINKKKISIFILSVLTCLSLIVALVITSLNDTYYDIDKIKVIEKYEKLLNTQIIPYQKDIYNLIENTDLIVYISIIFGIINISLIVFVIIKDKWKNGNKQSN